MSHHNLQNLPDYILNQANNAAVPAINIQGKWYLKQKEILEYKQIKKKIPDSSSQFEIDAHYQELLMSLYDELLRKYAQYKIVKNKINNFDNTITLTVEGIVYEL